MTPLKVLLEFAQRGLAAQRAADAAIAEAARARPSFQCPQCQRVSFNPHDVEHRYCGFCHEFNPQGTR
jgi:hypothetical protein